jgi:hypothetical protein
VLGLSDPKCRSCEILVTGLIARVANNSPDPLRLLTDFRGEIKAVVKGVDILGMNNTIGSDKSREQRSTNCFR